MSKIKNTFCYAPLVQKIQDMDSAIQEMKMRVEKLKHAFCEGEAEMKEEELEETCPDVIESEIALMEIMKDMTLQMVLEEEPEGDA